MVLFMARPLRLQFPGALYHITARGNARADIVADDHDRQAFVDTLAREIGQQGWRCYAWCLMDNHYHLLVETPEANLVPGMRRLNQVYTQGYNRRHARVGHVLQGRYKSILVDKESHFLELCRYVVLNPMRARMVRSAQDWAWSSYRATAGLRQAPPWLAADAVLEQFGDTPQTAQVAYRRFVREGLGAESPWVDLRGQVWLGGEAFRERMGRMVAQYDLSGVAQTQRHPERPSVEDVLESVGASYKVEPGSLWSRVDQRAFQAAVYLLRRAVNLSLKQVSALVGVSPSRVSRIQSNIEAQKRDVALASLLERYNVKL